MGKVAVLGTKRNTGNAVVNTTTKPTIKFLELWKLLRRTYQTNKRDIRQAYGNTFFAKVHECYANNYKSVSAVLLTNRTPINENHFQAKLEKNIFVVALTLKQLNNLDKDALTVERISLAKECRLFTLDVLNSDEIAQKQTFFGLLEKPNQSSLPTTTFTMTTTTTTEAADYYHNYVVFTTYDTHDRDSENDEENDSEVDDVDDTDGNVNGEEDLDDNDNNKNNNNAVNGSTRPQQRIVQRGSNFNVIGVRREHWLIRSYRNFFHSFLQSLKSLPVHEDIDTYNFREDTDRWLN